MNSWHTFSRIVNVLGFFRDKIQLRTRIALETFDYNKVYDGQTIIMIYKDTDLRT